MRPRCGHAALFIGLVSPFLRLAASTDPPPLYLSHHTIPGLHAIVQVMREASRIDGVESP